MKKLVIKYARYPKEPKFDNPFTFRSLDVYSEEDKQTISENIEYFKSLIDYFAELSTKDIDDLIYELELFLDIDSDEYLNSTSDEETYAEEYYSKDERFEYTKILERKKALENYFEAQLKTYCKQSELETIQHHERKINAIKENISLVFNKARNDLLEVIEEYKDNTVSNDKVNFLIEEKLPYDYSRIKNYVRLFYIELERLKDTERYMNEIEDYKKQKRLAKITKK